MSAPRLGAHIASSKDSPWWGIHAARYYFASEHLGPGRILDVACGTGYGMTLLAADNREIVGVDSDPGALQDAARHGTVYRADACGLPFPDDHFDGVVSLETIEHLPDPARFVREIARVTRVNGIAIISTPNALRTKPVEGVPRNPHHIHEFEPGELRVLLGGSFGAVAMLGQTLSPKYISPFWNDQQHMQRNLPDRAKLLVWRAIHKLPSSPRDLLSQLAWHHPLFPDARDYVFAADGLDAAPDMIAICAKTIR